MAAGFPYPYGTDTLNACPYAGGCYGGKIEVVSAGADLPGCITITTDYFTFVPVSQFADLFSKEPNSKQRVYEFYENLLGSPHVMREFSDGKVMASEEIVQRVDRYIQKWYSHDFFSAFVVCDSKTMQPIAHAILDQEEEVGSARYELLVSDCEDRFFWKEAIYKEITYAMFLGWAVYLSDENCLVGGQVFKKITAMGNTKEIQVSAKPQQVETLLSRTLNRIAHVASGTVVPDKTQERKEYQISVAHLKRISLA